MTHDVDTLVIGAGVIGSSVAMHLGQHLKGAEKIRVVDFDLEGSLSSSELNAGGVRATWVQPINIQTSQVSINYFASVAEDVGYRACGYLWLHTAEKLESALQARERQVAMGWPVESWDVAELRRKVPFIDKTDGIAGALFSPRDGLINPNLLKNHYRAKARENGVTFDDQTLIRKIETTASGIEVIAERFDRVIPIHAKMDVLSGKDSGISRTLVRYRAKRVVNCAGPWASEVAKGLGYASPSHPVRRQVCIFDCRDVDLTQYGMIVDTSGVYFHPEAMNGLAGFATPGEPAGVNFSYDGESFFQDVIWPALYERSTGFERLKHLTGWAGLYEVSPDECAIIGEVDRSNGRLFEAHSFSGHGVMHSYAAGLAVAERIVKGRYETIDLSELAGNRFAKGRSIREGLVI